MSTIDVLAVLDATTARLARGIKRGEEIANDPWPSTTPSDRRIAREVCDELIKAKRVHEEARAAVAELIDSIRDEREKRDVSRKVGFAVYGMQIEYDAAVARTDAAIARIGGAA